MVTVMACAGTSSSPGKWPSLTCCRRQAASSSTTLTSTRVGEIGHRRVVEGQVPVLADPEAAQVERVLPQEAGVAAALGLGVARAPHVVRGPGVGRLDDALPDPALEARRVVGSHPDVLVHVEDDGVGPGHPRRSRAPAPARRPAGSCRWRTWRGPRPGRPRRPASRPRASSAAARAMAARRRWTCTVAPSMVRVPVCTAFSMPGAASARLDRCATSSSRAGPAGGGVDGGAPLPGGDARWWARPSSGPAVSVKLETLQPTGLVQGARRAGRRVRHAGGRTPAAPWWPRRPATTAWGWPTPRPSSAPPSPWWCPRAPRRPRCRPCSSSTSAWCCTARATGEAETHALELAAEDGSRYVSPYNDPDVIAGQATAGPRAGRAGARASGTVVVPCGGGGLLAGVTLGLEGTGVRVVGVESEASPSMSTALAAGAIVPIEVEPTVADGLAGNLEPGAVTVGVALAPRRRGAHGQRGRHPLRHGLLGLQDGPRPRGRRCRRCGRAAGRGGGPRRRRKGDRRAADRAQRGAEAAVGGAPFLRSAPTAPRSITRSAARASRSCSSRAAASRPWPGTSPWCPPWWRRATRWQRSTTGASSPSSSPPAPYSVEGMAADTVALLDHLGWAEPVRIAGHSMGGWIAETLVLDHPERVRSAAFMGSANAPTAWEVAITTVERDLARLDYDLPPLFYATETLRYLPIADLQDNEVVSTWLSMMGDMPAWPNPGPAGPVRGGPGLVDRPGPHHALARGARPVPGAGLRARRRLAAALRPARRPRPFPAASTARWPAPGTSASSPTPSRWPPTSSSSSPALSLGRPAGRTASVSEAQILMHRADAGRSLPDGAGHPLGGARAHIADGEEPGMARLEGQGEAVQVPPSARRGPPAPRARSVSTKPRSSSLAHPEIHSDVGSAPMNEKSPVQGTSAVPAASVIATARRSCSPTSPVICASVRTVIRGVPVDAVGEVVRHALAEIGGRG